MCTYMYFIIFFSLFSHRASPRHASVSVTVTHLTENVIDVQFADETSTGTNVGDTPVHHGLPQLNKLVSSLQEQMMKKTYLVLLVFL